MQRPQEDEPPHQRDRQQEEDAEDVAGQREEDRQREHEQAERDREHAEAQLRTTHQLVLLARDAARVVGAPAALARPALAVVEIVLDAALAADGDRRAAPDRARALTAPGPPGSPPSAGGRPPPPQAPKAAGPL